jgi:flavodoxin
LTLPPKINILKSLHSRGRVANECLKCQTEIISDPLYHREFWKGGIGMRTLVTYFTQSGNTKKVADAIFGVIEGEKEIKPIEDVDAVEGYDLIFVGSPMHGFGLNENVKAFVEKNGKGKNIALFVTHASPEEAIEQLQPWLDSCKEAAAGTNLVGFFNCQGELSKELADAMVKLDDSQAVSWGKQRDVTLGQPDPVRLERARAFARETISKMSLSPLKR